MELTRRGFLGSMLAAAAAPLVLTDGVARGIIMPVREIITAPPLKQVMTQAPEWDPQITDISAYAGNYSMIVSAAPIDDGVRYIARRNCTRSVDLTMLNPDGVQPLDVIEVTVCGKTSAFMVTQVGLSCGSPGELLKAAVRMEEIGLSDAPATRRLDLDRLLAVPV